MSEPQSPCGEQYICASDQLTMTGKCKCARNSSTSFARDWLQETELKRTDLVHTPGVGFTATHANYNELDVFHSSCTKRANTITFNLCAIAL